MFKVKKCKRCQGVRVKEWIVNVVLNIIPYKQKRNIKRFIKDKCWICEECNAIHYKAWTYPGDFVLIYGDEKTHKEEIKNRYEVDKSNIEVLYKQI